MKDNATDDESDDEFFDAYDNEEDALANAIVKDIASLPITDKKIRNMAKKR